MDIYHIILLIVLLLVNCLIWFGVLVACAIQERREENEVQM
jgi:hypothetical protein